MRRYEIQQLANGQFRAQLKTGLRARLGFRLFLRIQGDDAGTSHHVQSGMYYEKCLGDIDEVRDAAYRFETKSVVEVIEVGRGCGQ